MNKSLDKMKELLAKAKKISNTALTIKEKGKEREYTVQDRANAIAKEKEKERKNDINVSSVKRTQDKNDLRSAPAKSAAEKMVAKDLARDAKKKTVRRKSGEKKGLTTQQRSEKEAAAKLSDPATRTKALLGNIKNYAQKVQANKKKEAAYDEGVNRDDGQSSPVATKKRTGAYIAQTARRKNATDRKLINKESKGELNKGMKNGGIGGPGSVKLGAIKPSIKAVSLTKPGSTNSSTPSIGQAPASKKDPMLAAQQTQNKDIKDIKMKEAQQHLVKIESNGQWSMEKVAEGKAQKEAKGLQVSADAIGKDSYYTEKEKRKADLSAYDAQGKANAERQKAERTQTQANKKIKDRKDVNAKILKPSKNLADSVSRLKDKFNQIQSMKKSGYKGYTDTDNIKRKANNTGETTGIHTMDSIKEWGGSGVNAASKEAKEMKRRSKKNPVKTFTPAEIAEYSKNKKE